MKIAIYLLVVTLLITPVVAKPFELSMYSIVKESLGGEIELVQDKIILSKDELLSIKKIAKVPVKSKLYRYYKVNRGDEVVAYVILISQRVRTKKATVLYLIKDDKIKLIEILTFLEPREYIPNSTWISQFDDKNISSPFKVREDIQTITGATMSAKSITDGARVAIALYRLKLK